MINLRKVVVLAASLAALAACAKTAPQAPDTAADETAARAVNIAWYKAYNAGDGAGVGLVDGPTSDVSVSGDLAWQWGTFKITDKSGAGVDAGKYLTVFQRKDGKWVIIRDTWNSDAAPAAPAPGAPPK